MEFVIFRTLNPPKTKKKKVIDPLIRYTRKILKVNSQANKGIFTRKNNLQNTRLTSQRGRKVMNAKGTKVLSPIQRNVMSPLVTSIHNYNRDKSPDPFQILCSSPPPILRPNKTKCLRGPVLNLTGQS